MSSREQEDKEDRYMSHPNSGLESLAAEASRRAESLDAEFTQPEPHGRQSKSPSRSSGAKGKVRKAYTITKQRERWTEEEHDRFLQALKRYGRAWRKIEEHIGTKTAVQIRSHAQKFFSKLQREQRQNGGQGDESSKNNISIPPPRPKRKPAHPYPRNSTDNSAEPNEVSYMPASREKSPSHRPSDLTTASTQVPTNNSHILPGFPALDASSGEMGMNKILKDAAVAAANAWNQVVANAGMAQAQPLLQPPALPPMQPLCGLNTNIETNDSPFMRQLLMQIAAQQQGTQPYMRMNTPASSRHTQGFFPGQASVTTATGSQHDNNGFASASYIPGRTRVMSETPEGLAGVPESDRDSACSKEKQHNVKLPSFHPTPAFNTQAPQVPFWNPRSAIPAGADEARLGQKAREMVQQAARHGPQQAAPGGSDDRTSSLPTGEEQSSRKIFKPAAQPAACVTGGSLHVSPDGRSQTSQLAEFYQRAAGRGMQGSTSPRRHQVRLSGGIQEGTPFGGAEYEKPGSKRPRMTHIADKSSDRSNETLDDTNASLDDFENKGMGEEGSNDGDKARPSTELDTANYGSSGTDKSSLPGSDKASNNGNTSASDEDAQANASDLLAHGSEGKASDGGSNNDRLSARQYTPSGTRNSSRDMEAPSPKNLSRPDSLWSNVQYPGSEHKHAHRASTMQQMIPGLNLTPYQQQTLSAWAAANASQPQQYQLMQTLLAGFHSPAAVAKLGSEQGNTTVQGSRGPSSSFGISRSMPAGTSDKVFDRRASCLTSADTGSHQDCNITFPLGSTIGSKSCLLDARSSAPGLDTSHPNSGFKPYNKRPSISLDTQSGSKRFAVEDTDNRPKHVAKETLLQSQTLGLKTGAETSTKIVTPFGSLAVQKSQNS